MCFEQNSRYRGSCINCKASDNDYYKANGKRQSLEKCFNLCKSRVDCNFYSWRTSNKQCQMFEKIHEKIPVEDGFAGRIDCNNQGMKLNLIWSLSNVLAQK